MGRDDIYKQWGLLWHSRNRLDGLRESLCWEDRTLLMFHTRQEARSYATKQDGYIKTRKDLRQEPHGWRLPMPVRLISIQWKKPCRDGQAQARRTLGVAGGARKENRPFWGGSPVSLLRERPKADKAGSRRTCESRGVGETGGRVRWRRRRGESGK